MKHTKGAKENGYTDFLIAQYQVLSAHRIDHNSLLWSIPSLMFFAQTLLWGIIFDRCWKEPVNTESYVVGIILSLFSILVGFASLQCFMRNRLMEIADTEQMYIIERTFREMYKGNPNCPIPILIVSHKLRNRTWFEDGTVNVSEIGVEKDLKTWLRVKFKNQLYFKHSSSFWNVVFIISILLPIFNIICIFFAWPYNIQFVFCMKV